MSDYNLVLKSDERKARAVLAAWELAQRDNWTFLTRFCHTHNPHAPAERRVALFPQEDYLYELCDVWKKERAILIFKSRQLLVSWWSVAMIVWESIRSDHQISWVQSKLLADAGSPRNLNSLLYRALFMIQHMPKFAKIKYDIVWSPSPILQLLSTGSTITAASSDYDVIRSSCCNNVLVDEAAALPDLAANLAAIKPTLGHEGHLLLVSTPRDRDLFYNIINDTES